MTGDDLVVLIPVWRRTKNIVRVYESAVAATPDANVLFVASIDDGSVRAVLEEFCLDHLLVEGPGGGTGDYARKINAGYAETTAPVLFTGADDIEFQPGWYETARRFLYGGDPATADRLNGVVGVVGTNDGCNARTFDPTVGGFPSSTHSLVARWYADSGGCVDQDHVVYHEGYWHEYCDDELVQTALVRGAYVHALDAVVRHLHPNAGRATDDETYQRGRSKTRHSRNLFLLRRRLWNPTATPGLPGIATVHRR